MSRFSTDAILLKRIEYGDHDLILTLLTRERGKISTIAKSAKKSVKRFGGILEPFSMLTVVCTAPRRSGGMPVLQEASIATPLPHIRSDIYRTAHASYWAELIMVWAESEQQQDAVYRLLAECLARLDRGGTEDAAFLSVVFQMQFLNLAGLPPNLRHCAICRNDVDQLAGDQFQFHIPDGTMTCRACGKPSLPSIRLSRRTLKQMLWIQQGGVERALRVRLPSSALAECTTLLTQFVPYHLGKSLKSLDFLAQLKEGGPGRRHGTDAKQ